MPTDKCNTAETQELKCLLCLDSESPPCPWVILGRKRKTNKIISEKSLGLGELGTSPKFRAVCAWRLRVGAKGSCLASFLVVWKVSCDGGGMTWDLHLHLHTLLLPFSQHPPKGREMRRIQPGLSPSRMLAPVSHSPEGLSWGQLVTRAWAVVKPRRAGGQPLLFIFQDHKGMSRNMFSNCNNVE